MNKYRREVTIEIIVGLFMFIVLIALGIFTIVLSRENMLKKSYPYEFIFSEVSGLREGDNVFLRGMNVGRVKQMDLYGSHVRVFVSLDVPLNLRRGYKIDVTSSSMLGGKFLKINEGPEKAPPLEENMTVLGERPVDVLEELGSAVSGLQSMINAVNEGQGTLGKLLNDEATYDNMVRITEKLGNIIARVERGEGSLGKLLIADEGQLFEDAKVTMNNLRTISESLAGGESTLGKMLASEEGELFEDLRMTLANLRALSQSIADGEGTLGRLIAGDAQAYEDFQATMAAVRSISQRIDAGEGTMGKLVRDDTLYDETTLMLEDVRAAIDDLREASPITSFGSVFFGAF